MAHRLAASEAPFAVAIPTRDRPEKLRWCLEALARAHADTPFAVYVLDSSTTAETRGRVREVCAAFDFCRLGHHDGTNLAMARNACARAVAERLVINVDDDIQVEPEAPRLLVEAYLAHEGPRVVAGSVAWGDWWSAPRRLTPLGWGDDPPPGRPPDFLIGAFFLYPKALALAFPWRERVLPGPRRGVADDRYIGALWRSKGVALLFEPRARARHHPEHNEYGVADQAAHVYTTLVQGLVGSRSWRRTASFEALGFLQGAKAHLRHRGHARTFLRSWVAGHRAFIADCPYHRDLARRELPRSGW